MGTLVPDPPMSNFSLLRSLEVLPQGSLSFENLTVVDAVNDGAQQKVEHRSRLSAAAEEA